MNVISETVINNSHNLYADIPDLRFVPLNYYGRGTEIQINAVHIQLSYYMFKQLGIYITHTVYVGTGRS